VDNVDSGNFDWSYLLGTAMKTLKQIQDEFFSKVIKEAVSVSALDKTLMPLKRPVKGKLTSDVGEYVDVLEFVVDWLALRSSANDKDFEDFAQKISQSYQPGEIKSPSFKAKAAKVKKVDKDDVEVDKKSQDQPQKTDKTATSTKVDEPNKGTPPPLPKSATSTAAAAAAPAVGKAAKKPASVAKAPSPKEKPKQSEPDFQPLSLTKAMEPQKNKSKNDDPSALPSLSSLTPPPTKAPVPAAALKPQSWNVGQVVDVDGLPYSVKEKRGKDTYILKNAKGEEYIISPHLSPHCRGNPSATKQRTPM